MYHPTIAETSLGGAQKCFDIVRVRRITAGHLSTHLPFKLPLPAILRLSEDGDWKAWHAALRSGYVLSPAKPFSAGYTLFLNGDCGIDCCRLFWRFGPCKPHALVLLSKSETAPKNWDWRKTDLQTDHRTKEWWVDRSCLVSNAHPFSSRTLDHCSVLHPSKEENLNHAELNCWNTDLQMDPLRRTWGSWLLCFSYSIALLLP